MSPDRLFRHDDPGDTEVVTWGELRDVAARMTERLRRALHVIAAIAVCGILLLLGAFAVMGIIIDRVDNQASTTARTASTTARTAMRGTKAVCGLIVYAEKQAYTNPQVTPKGRQNLLDLADDMRATGVECPPRQQPQP